VTLPPTNVIPNHTEYKSGNRRWYVVDGGYHWPAWVAMWEHALS